jgi:Uma2 family endonuclease
VKRQLYGKYRVPEYWILDADSRAVEVYRLRNEVLDLVAIFREGNEITTPLLPGFKCAVARSVPLTIHSGLFTQVRD